MTASSRGISVYLHVPFCIRKCPYCAFSSASLRPGDEEKYLRAATAAIVARSRRENVVETLYIGGGTPSALSADAWRVLCETLESAFFWADDAEVTVEANPGSLTAAHLRIWKAWRVTRLSIGVQSFDDAELALLGRVHCAAQAADAVSACRAAGFQVSLDLMFGLPGGTLRNWARTLGEALYLKPDHLSIYQLSIEPGTPFAARYPDGQGLSDGYAPYRFAQWYLPRKGYAQYEVASFARAGRESRHNLRYWADGDYIGIGPAAWGYEDGRRYRNAPSLDAYAARVEAGEDTSVYEETLTGEAAARQAAVLALRTRDGIDWPRFASRYGAHIAEAIRAQLEQFPASLVTADSRGARLTPAGLRVANRIWSEII